jgi:hypothetical protein
MAGSTCGAYVGRKKLISRLFSAAFALAIAPAAFSQVFDQCGTVVAGVTCPKHLRADDQTVWLLDVPHTA